MKSNQWWDEDSKNVHHAVNSSLTSILDNQSDRLTRIMRNVRSYNVTTPTTQPVFSYNQPTLSRDLNHHSDIPTINVIKSCVDTAASKIAKNKVKATIQTENAPWQVRQTLLQAETEVRSYWTKSDVNIAKLMRQIFIDAAITGTGVIKVISGPQIKYERVLSSYIAVDEMDGLYGFPQSMIQYQFVSKEELKKLFKGKEDIIDAAETCKVDGVTGAESVRVMEAWKLPADKAGRHVICVSTGLLFEEEWNQSFPFIFMKFSESITGFFGVSLVDDIYGIQFEINKVLESIRQCVHLGMAPKWLVHASASLPGNMLNNRIGSIVKYAGNVPPSYIAPAPFSPQVLQYLEWLIQQAYNMSGVSSLSAQSQKPAGLDSGKALRTFNDIETQRFVLIGQEFEDAHVKLFQKTIEAIERVISSDGNFRFSDVSDYSFYEDPLDWKDVIKEIKKVNVAVFPTSMLPATPEGKLAFVQEMLAAGKLDDDSALELLDFPDTAAYREKALAPVKAVRKAIADIIKFKMYQPPEEIDNLDAALRISTQEYLSMRNAGAPDDVLSLLRQYIEDVNQLIESLQPPPVQQPQQLQGQPAQV